MSRGVSALIKEFVLVCGVGLLLCGVLADSPAWAIGGGALMIYSGVAM